MRTRAAAILVQAGRLLVIHRFKAQREYYVLPGGGVEAGETPAEACQREVREESGLEVEALQQVWVFDNRGNREHYFQVQTRPGVPCLGGPEKEQNGPDDQYILEWVGLEQLDQIPLLPGEVKAICREVLSTYHPPIA